MKSAFGVEHTISKKARDDRNVSGGALAGGGAVAAGGGLLGGGIPGVKSDYKVLDTMREKNAPLKQRVGAAVASGRGGILGYRTDAHRKVRRGWINDGLRAEGTDAANHGDWFHRNVNAGKVDAESKVINHLKAGRKASNAVLVGGLATTAYGVHRMNSKPKKKKVSKAQKDVDQYHGAMLGAGLTGAGGAYGIKRVLAGQGEKWKAEEKSYKRRAKRAIPSLPVDKHPDELRADGGNRYLGGTTGDQAKIAGRNLGRAQQAGYFSHVYNKSAKGAGRVIAPSLAVAAVGAGGLKLSRKGQKKGKR